MLRKAIYGTNGSDGTDGAGIHPLLPIGGGFKMLCGVMAKIIFRLDSICPTGAGKVAGVKIENHEEMWVSEVAAMTRLELWSAAINGIDREKAPSVAKAMEGRQKEHPPSLKLPRTGWRDYTVILGFSRCRFAGRRHEQGSDWPGNGRQTAKSLMIWELLNRFQTEVDNLGPEALYVVLRGWGSTICRPCFLVSARLMTFAPQGQLSMQGIDPLQDKWFLVHKRDGRIEEFNEARVLLAIESAFKAHHGLPQDAPLADSAQAAARSCADLVVQRVLSRAVRGEELEVERIQDTVEDQLMLAGHLEVARRYILYREKRRLARVERESRPKPSSSIKETSDLPKTALGSGLAELRNIYRQALPRQRDSEQFEAVYRRQFDGCLNEGDYWRRLTSELLEFDSERLARGLRIERDQQINAASLELLRDRYLLREEGRCLETPQYFWMRIAMGLALNEQTRQEERALEFYEALSTGRFIASDLILRNAGTRQSVLAGGGEAGASGFWVGAWRRDILDVLDWQTPMIPDLFMKRVQQSAAWTLLDRGESSDLEDCYGREFEKRYLAYEQKAKQGALCFSKRIKAVDLWHQIVAAVARSSQNRIGFQDAMGLRPPYRGQSSVVPLGAINLAAHIPEGGGALDLGLLRATVSSAVRMLDNAVDLNLYPSDLGRLNALDHRAIGLGVAGFQEALDRLHLASESNAAADFADWSMELVSCGAITASAELARERGPFPGYAESHWRDGIVPIDTLAQLSQERGLLVDVTADVSQDWASVREKVRSYGMRNGATTAIAALETPVRMAGLTPSIETPRGDAEIDAKWLIECAARRQKWIDLGQALTIRTSEREPAKMVEHYMQAWEKGLQTVRVDCLATSNAREKRAVEAGVQA
jgi:ribonucleotide reductase alpha subunit